VNSSFSVRAPTRIDFGGGWTDVPPYDVEQGGFVCNVAITRYATVHFTALPDPGADPELIVQREGDGALLRAVGRKYDIRGARISLTNDFPVAAGLGGSSAAGVAAIAAAQKWLGKRRSRPRIAEASRALEVEEMGIAGGRQDHYAAAFGGALLLTSRSPVQVERIPLSDACASALARRIILVYTGQSRISSRTIAAVADACRVGDARVCHALDECKRLAHLMADALRRGDIDALGELVGEHWTHQRALHPSITTDRIDAIHDACTRSGALGMKALGASGGGCVMAITRDGAEDALTSALAPFGERLAFQVDHTGFHLLPSGR